MSYTCTCVLSHSKLVRIEMVIRNVINTKPLFNAHSMLLSVRAIDAEFCDTKSQTKLKYFSPWIEVWCYMYCSCYCSLLISKNHKNIGTIVPNNTCNLSVFMFVFYLALGEY